MKTLDKSKKRVKAPILLPIIENQNIKLNKIKEERNKCVNFIHSHDHYLEIHSNKPLPRPPVSTFFISVI